MEFNEKNEFERYFNFPQDATSVDFPSQDPFSSLPLATQILNDSAKDPNYEAFQVSCPDLLCLDDFSNYLPSYSKPVRACDYCSSRQLECFTFDGNPCCTACQSLFRQCSLSCLDSTAQSHNQIDLLFPLQDCPPHDVGSLVGAAPLMTAETPSQQIKANEQRDLRTNTTRFPRATTRILKTWLEDHAENPYPTEDEKEHLKLSTGLKSSQISMWLANARRRSKNRQSAMHTGSQPIDIVLAPPKDDMTPLERWRASPPENEPALVSDIERALAKTGRRSGASSRSDSRVSLQRTPSDSALSALGTPSTVSLETASTVSQGSGSAHSHGSHSSYNSFGRKDRRSKRRLVRKTLGRDAPAQRPFRCTFCTDSFQTKYDWTRHEKSLHLKVGKWMCSPLGPVIVVDTNGTNQCVFCGALNPARDPLNPSNDHSCLEAYFTCHEKDREARTFYRKDHLTQHLRLVHGVTMTEHMELWNVTPSVLRSRCGFCPTEVTFEDWDARADHLSKHFRDGATMTQWHGSWGFDDEIEKMVTSAIPPYLIGFESTTPVPFSATDSSQHHSMEYRDSAEFEYFATCWQILTIHLGQYARRQMELGLDITDADLQREARMVIYGDDDTWNQTAADIPEWLAVFKRSHGVGGDMIKIPSAADAGTLSQAEAYSQGLTAIAGSSGVSCGTSTGLGVEFH